MQQFQTLLSENFPGLGADIHVITAKEMTVNLKPVEPQATIPPQSITLRISLEGEAGRRAREQYERFIKTGAGFTFETEHLKGIELTDLLKTFYGISEDKLSSFSFTPTPSPPVPWNFKRICEDGVVAVLPRVELSTIQAGTEEATLSNETQGVPWRFTIVVRFETEGLRVHRGRAATGIAPADRIPQRTIQKHQSPRGRAEAVRWTGHQGSRAASLARQKQRESRRSVHRLALPVGSRTEMPFSPRVILKRLSSSPAYLTRRYKRDSGCLGGRKDLACARKAGRSSSTLIRRVC